MKKKLLITTIIATLFIVQLILAINQTNTNRTIEINSALNIIQLIVFAIIIIVIIYLITDHLAKQKHIQKAKKIVHPIRRILKEFELEQEEKKEKQKLIEQKTRIYRQQLEKTLRQKRINKDLHQKIIQVLSEFDDSDELLKPSDKPRKQVFKKLNILTKNKIKHTTQEDLFKKLEKLAEETKKIN